MTQLMSTEAACLCILDYASSCVHLMLLTPFISWFLAGGAFYLGEPHPRRQTDHITNLICHGDVKQMAGLGGRDIKRLCKSHLCQQAAKITAYAPLSLWHQWLSTMVEVPPRYINYI